MKGYFLAVLLCAAGTLSAQDRPLNVETFSTMKSDIVVRQSGWIPLGKAQGKRAWYAHANGNLSVVGVAVKIATRGIGNEYATVEVDTAFVNCSEAPQGRFPLHLHSLSIEMNDAQTGAQSSDNKFEPVADMVPIPGGSIIADAVRRSCLDVMRETSKN